MVYPDITQASKTLFESGVRLLQGNRFADTDEGHIDALSKWMRLNGERNIADMGCGFGEVSRLLAKQLPDTTFWLVNNNEYQIRRCPEGSVFQSVFRDMHDTGLGDGLMDMVMFNWSFCHSDPKVALKEAARITNRDGRMFVYDYERVSGDNELTAKHLFANFISTQDFCRLASEAGWRLTETIYPGGNSTILRQAVGNDQLYREMFKHLVPVIWKAVKSETASN